MKIIFLGCNKFSKEILLELIKNKFDIISIFSIPKNFKINNEKIKNYNFVNLNLIAKKHNIDFNYINNNKELLEYKSYIKDLKPDIILILGWYYIIPKEILNIPKYYTCGIHASLLPNYSGWAPLVWAIIKGEKHTGITLFKMTQKVDEGDIIAQEKFEISFNDSIKEVYNKAIIKSKKLLINTLKNINKIKLKKQDLSKKQVFPRRTPEDGEINLNKNALEIYNFIRAQSNPYPGAFIKTIDNKKLIIEKARIE